MSDTHDMRHTFPLWWSKAGREIMWDRCFLERTIDGTWAIYDSKSGTWLCYDMSEAPSHIRDALAWRTRQWLIAQGAERIPNHPRDLFAESMRVAAVGDDNEDHLTSEHASPT
jgi:hypothetical protein